MNKRESTYAKSFTMRCASVLTQRLNSKRVNPPTQRRIWNRAE